jgi:hypothetical protein
MSNKKQIFWHYLINYWWIPMGITYMLLGNDTINRFWYDDLWNLYGNILFIVGIFMCFGCIIIHMMIFLYEEFDKHIRTTVRNEMGKGETNK